MSGAKGVARDCCSSGAVNLTHKKEASSIIYKNKHALHERGLGEVEMEKCRNMLRMIIYCFAVKAKRLRSKRGEVT